MTILRTHIEVHKSGSHRWMLVGFKTEDLGENAREVKQVDIVVEGDDIEQCVHAVTSNSELSYYSFRDPEGNIQESGALTLAEAIQASWEERSTPSLTPMKADRRCREQGNFELDGFRYSLDGPNMTPVEFMAPTATDLRDEERVFFCTGMPGDKVSDTDTWVSPGDPVLVK